MEQQNISIDETKIKERITIILETNPIVKMLKPLFKMKRIADENTLLNILQFLPEILVILSKDKRGLEILKETGILNEITKQ